MTQRSAEISGEGKRSAMIHPDSVKSWEAESIALRAEIKRLTHELSDAEIAKAEKDVEIERLKAERNRATTLASKLALDVAKHAVEIERLRRWPGVGFQQRVAAHLNLWDFINEDILWERRLPLLDPETRISQCGLSVRTANCLINSDVRTIADLVAMSDRDLIRIPNFGRKSLREVLRFLARHGSYLKDWKEEWWR